MEDLLQIGEQFLADLATDRMARSVTYGRGTDSVVVRAQIGSTTFESMGAGGGGPIAEVVSRDYLIRAADLILAGNVIEPERGDKITEVLPDGTTIVCEVLIHGNEPAWRWADNYKISLRIHTKETS
jgi:hypothetical protein